VSYIGKGALTAGLVAAALAAVGGLTTASAAQSRSGAAASEQIAIHEHGTIPTRGPGDAGFNGSFSIELALTPFGQGGTSRTAFQISLVRHVSGQAQIPLAGVDTLTGKSGTLQLAFSGVYIPINTKLEYGNTAVGPAVEHGAWRITAATGVYNGWTGGGVWAAVVDGYGHLQPYSVEWDGDITR
jgi:hypothetical protein